MTHAKRTDNNQLKIVYDLRAVGASVALTHLVGNGFPDLAVGYRGHNYLLETKCNTGNLNPRQHLWHQLWRGNVFIVHNSQEALAAIGAVEYRTLPQQEDPVG